MSTETEIATLRYTSPNQERDLNISQFGGPDGEKFIQLTQGMGGYLTNNPYEPGFIQLAGADVDRLISILTSWRSNQEESK